MFFGWFGRKRPPIPDKLHAAIVAAARQPALYAEFGVPDSVDGRFEMLCVHLFLFLRRARSSPELAELSQEVVDRTFADLDRNLRESGVGDLSVPRRMKSLAGMFYARVALYAPPLEAADAPALARELEKTVFADAPPAGAPRLAHYMLQAGGHLASIPAENVLTGEISFPAP